ncbi:hypothetical protein Tco_0282638 [Tanacetum coccineum]
MLLFSSPKPTVSYFDDLDFFKDFENEFLAIVYNDALTYKSDSSTEPVEIPHRIDEFDLKSKTSLSECNEEEQNIVYFNGLFPFNIIYPDDLKSDKDNDDKIDIKQSSGDTLIVTRFNVSRIMNPVIALDNAMVAPDDRVKIGKCNMRIHLTKTNKEATYQVVLDTLSRSPCYNAFTNTADICPRLPNQEFIEPPSHDEIVTFIKSLGYKGALESVPDLVTGHMYQPWRIFASIINRCLSGKTTDIENSKAYKTYLAYSTGAATPKNARKWKQPKKKSSLSADDNIIFEDPDDALELAKSISKTEAEEQEAARLMHETYECLVIEKPTERRRQICVVFRDTPTVPQKKPLNQSQKLKGIQVMSVEQRLAADTKKAINTNKLATGPQQTKGSSTKSDDDEENDNDDDLSIDLEETDKEENKNDDDETQSDEHA